MLCAKGSQILRLEVLSSQTYMTLIDPTKSLLRMKNAVFFSFYFGMVSNEYWYMQLFLVPNTLQIYLRLYIKLTIVMAGAFS